MTFGEQRKQLQEANNVRNFSVENNDWTNKKERLFDAWMEDQGPEEIIHYLDNTEDLIDDFVVELGAIHMIFHDEFHDLYLQSILLESGYYDGDTGLLSSTVNPLRIDDVIRSGLSNTLSIDYSRVGILNPGLLSMVSSRGFDPGKPIPLSWSASLATYVYAGTNIRARVFQNCSFIETGVLDKKTIENVGIDASSLFHDHKKDVSRNNIYNEAYSGSFDQSIGIKQVETIKTIDDIYDLVHPSFIRLSDVKAVSFVESNLGGAKDINKRASKGPMQLLKYPVLDLLQRKDKYVEEFDALNLNGDDILSSYKTDNRTNIKIGTLYLRQIEERYLGGQMKKIDGALALLRSYKNTLFRYLKKFAKAKGVHFDGDLADRVFKSLMNDETMQKRFMTCARYNTVSRGSLPHKYKYAFCILYFSDALFGNTVV